MKLAPHQLDLAPGPGMAATMGPEGTAGGCGGVQRSAPSGGAA